ncbi:MAG: FadR family transcriptional regulator [Planctomycetes bacterium]|nr:FadR family transcriptional regulator [Planctomycetota bacterium]
MTDKDPAIVPLSSKSSVAIVSEKLEELLLAGFWQPDEKMLSEADLGARFNVGRSTIREALNMLKAKQLVYTVPGLGTFAADPAAVGVPSGIAYVPDPKSEKDLVNIMELRLSLEPTNALFAARRATAAQLEELVQRHRELGATTRSALFAEADLEFHLLIARAAANPLFLDVMHMVKTFLLEQQILTSQEERRRSQAGRFHEQLVDAIGRRDERQAEAVMREHMDDTYRYIRKLALRGAPPSGRWPKRRAAGTGRPARGRKGLSPTK